MVFKLDKTTDFNSLSFICLEWFDFVIVSKDFCGNVKSITNLSRSRLHS